jgi:hypothetical protein
MGSSISATKLINNLKEWRQKLVLENPTGTTQFEVHVEPSNSPAFFRAQLLSPKTPSR